MKNKRSFGFLAGLAALSASASAAFSVCALAASPVAITVFHTNDLHSHFRSEKNALKQGGLARLRTAIKAARGKTPHSLLVDGGDWSEGSIYYTEGAGAESLRMMDLLGYDAAVVGNHDWLNGPGQLLDAIGAAKPRVALLGANFESGQFSRADEFDRAIVPYVTREFGGVKVAIVGLTNFDATYQSFIAPLRSTDAAPAAARLAEQLKKERLADVVIGVSHNAIYYNQHILRQAPALDLIVGAHDHQKLSRAVVVKREGAPDGWIVQAGKWGQYLGQVELSFTPGVAGSLKLQDSRLLPIDGSVAEDAETLSRIEALEARIESRLGNVFHDQVADCDHELGSEGLETQIGDFATDAYVKATGADIGVDQNRLIYGELRAGKLTTADFYNAMPAIYDPIKGKTWTLHTWKMKGSKIETVFRLLYTWRKISNSGGMSFSGLEVMYDPREQKEELDAGDLFGGLFGGGSKAVRYITIGGQVIDSSKTYTFAAGAGIVQGLKVINEKYFNIAEMTELTDTGIELWKAARDYARALGRIEASSVQHGGRVRTTQADLGIVPTSLRWNGFDRRPDGSIMGRFVAAVRNYGGSDSKATVATLEGSSVTLAVPALKPGETKELIWTQAVGLPYHGAYAFTVGVKTQDETNTANDSLTRHYAQ